MSVTVFEQQRHKSEVGSAICLSVVCPARWIRDPRDSRGSRGLPRPVTRASFLAISEIRVSAGSARPVLP
eukprot:1108491-Pyramimonas_sp.AAC.1